MLILRFNNARAQRFMHMGLCWHCAVLALPSCPCPGPGAMVGTAEWDPGSGSSPRGCSRADPAPVNAGDRHLSPSAHHAESWQSGKGHFQPLCPVSSGVHWSILIFCVGQELLQKSLSYEDTEGDWCGLMSPIHLLLFLFLHLPRVQESVSFLVQSCSFDLSPRDSRRKAKQVIWGRT